MADMTSTQCDIVEANPAYLRNVARQPQQQEREESVIYDEVMKTYAGDVTRKETDEYEYLPTF